MKLICTSCGVEKVASLENFAWREGYINKKGHKIKSTWRKQCRECISKKGTVRWHKNKKILKEKRKDYFIEYRNRPGKKEDARKRSRKHYLKHKDTEEFIQKRRKYQSENRDKQSIYTKNYRIRHSERLSLKEKERCKVDLHYRFRRRISTRIRNAIIFHTESNRKDRGTLELLDAPNIKFVWKHLESQFEPWMNWNNYGKYNKNYKTWQIDHKIPCASFDLKCPVQQLACFHWSNLQPLLSEENLKKGAKLDYEME